MYRNSCGYPAPTEGYVVAKLMHEYKQKQRQNRERSEEIKHRNKVYVVSKYAGDIKDNVLQAKIYCRIVAGQKCIPIASHLLFPRFLNDENPRERELGLLFGQALLAVCKEVWVFGTDYSEGMKAEIHEAKRLNKPIRFFDNECKEVEIWDSQKNLQH